VTTEAVYGHSRRPAEGEPAPTVVKANPSVGVLLRCSSVMLRVLTEFGLTPASEPRVSVKPDRIDDDLEAFLTRPNDRGRAGW
jgi:hypothetical protein